MDEIKQIAVIFAATLLIGIFSVIIAGTIQSLPADFGGDLTAESYEVTWSEDGTLTEKYVYDVKSSGEYRMLYRVWAAPLTWSASPDKIQNSGYIELTGVKTPDGTLGYIKTKSGAVYIFGEDSQAKSFVTDKAYENEAGILNLNYFRPGKYEVEYTYNIYPPIEYDDEAVHVNLMFAGKHIPYKNVKIVLESDEITEVFTHPPTYNIEKEDGKIIITGSSPEDEIIETEFLMNPEVLNSLTGYKRQISGIKEKTLSANENYKTGFFIADILLVIGKILVILTPLLFILLYLKSGKEKNFTVPEYLSTIPNKKLTPWQVNLVFSKDAFESDENGFYATLLSLHKQKKLRMSEKPDKKGILIELLDPESTDRYEQNVLNFVSLYSGDDNVLDTEYFESIAKSARHSSADEHLALAVKENLQSLTSGSDETISGKYATDGRGLLLPFIIGGIIYLLLAAALFVFAEDAAGTIFIAIFLGIAMIVQAVVAILFPSTVFGNWKEDYYKEKLEWDSFKNFLSDLSQIKKYSPDDINMWGEWLIYGTALGAGKNVEKAMKELNINISESGYFYPHYIWYAGFYSISTFTPPSQGGSGGGFGAGGGFGGGGAGGR
jgi:uncharacterized membrane protein